MNSKYLVDETVLVALLKKTDHSSLVWQLTYQKFNEHFIEFFQPNDGLSITRIQNVFDEVFPILISSLNQKTSNLNQSLFSLLLILGCNLLDCAYSKNQMIKVAPYLAGEVLVQLIQANHTQCLYCLFSHYKEPTMVILNNKYGSYFNVSPQEIYGEAIMVLKNNIEEGKLEFPMRSRLFTYFFLIARNKYLSLGNKMKGLVFYSDLIDFESKLNTTDSVGYFNNGNESQCPILKNLLDSPNKEVFKKLLDTFHIDEHELLRLRFEEGLRFKEIGKLLHLKEATCRKRLHDSIKRWKKQFFRGQVA